MNILVDGLSARAGGGVTRLSNLLRAMPVDKSQHQFFVLLSPIYQSTIIEQTQAVGHQVIPVNINGSNLLARSLFQNTAVKKIVRDFHIDAMYISGEAAYLHSPVPTVLLAGNLSLFSAPIGLTDTKIRRDLEVYRFLRFPLIRQSLRSVNCVAFVSNVMRDSVIKKARLSPSKTMILHHGLAKHFYLDKLPKATKKDQTPYLLCVSSIAPHKGYETLLEAYAKLAKKYQLPILRIAGSILHAPTFAYLQAIIEREGIGDKVQFLGSIPHDELPELYQNAEFFILPTRLESFGQPLLEAMGSGIPIIASDLPICKEICGDSALYSRVGDVESLRHQMENLLLDTSLQTMLSCKAQERAKDFTWEQTADKLLNKLMELA